jgi:predicted enzyme involved in methoxymalonyl-ACP biosynthesis
MSCRVLTRGVEQYLMNHVVEYAARANYRWIDAEYRPTAKNGMVKDFYAQFGFEKLPDSGDGVTRWRLAVAAYKPITVFIREAAAEIVAAAI